MSAEPRYGRVLAGLHLVSQHAAPPLLEALLTWRKESLNVAARAPGEVYVLRKRVRGLSHHVIDLHCGNAKRGTRCAVRVAWEKRAMGHAHSRADLAGHILVGGERCWSMNSRSQLLYGQNARLVGGTEMWWAEQGGIIGHCGPRRVTTACWSWW